MRPATEQAGLEKVTANPARDISVSRKLGRGQNVQNSER
jgi:hypothetical protein